MTTNEKIEKKASELFKEFSKGQYWKYTDEIPFYKDRWIFLARHFLAAEIESRIDEAKYYGYSYEDLSLSVKRIKELELQLSELKQ